MIERRPLEMVYAALDIHKSVFQAAVLDVGSGAVEQQRFGATRAALDDWAMRWRGELAAVAVEATTGWRWVVARLQGHGFEVRLVDPGRASALQGRRRRPKTDRLDARWLVQLLARELAPQAWIPPEQVQRLRDQTRLRKTLADERRRWAQRLHALLVQEGWPCARGRLLTGQGRRWVSALNLHPSARAYTEVALQMINASEAQLRPLEAELVRFARADRRCRALMQIYGVGELLACHLLAEIGQATRFRHPRQLVRAAGLDPIVDDSGERKRRGRLAKAGSPYLRFALVEAAQHARRRSSPDHHRYQRLAARIGPGRAKLTIARAIAARAHRALRQLEPQAAPS
jgi:transposase